MALLVALSWSSIGSWLAADEPTLEDIYQRVTILREQKLIAEAQLRGLEFEKKLLGAADSPEPDNATEPSVAVISQLQPVFPIIVDSLRASGQQRMDALTKLTASARKQHEFELARWRKASDAEVRMEERWRQAEERLGMPREATPHWSRIGRSPWGIAGWLVLLLLASAVLTLHERRRHIRRRLRSLRVARSIEETDGQQTNGTLKTLSLVVIFACGLASTCSGCGSPVPKLKARETWIGERRTALESEVTQLTAEIADMEQQVEPLQKDVDRQRRQMIDDLLARIHGTKQVQAGSPMALEVQSRESETYAALHEVLKLDHEARALRRESLNRIGELEKQETDLGSFLDRHNRQVAYLVGLKVVVVTIFGLVFLFPFQKALWQAWCERREYRRVCPRCRAVGTLETVKAAEGSFIKGEYKVICKNTICNSDFPMDVRKLMRLCFPTVGVTRSGKTHWMLTVYDQYKKDDVHSSASVSWLPSTEDKKLDAMLLDIQKIGKVKKTTWSGESPPVPLVLKVSDVDFIRPRSRTLLMLFDYAGELMEKKMDAQVMRQLALLMSGFLFFLDPTKVRPKKILVEKDDGSIEEKDDLTLNDQINAAQAFKNDLRTIISGRDGKKDDDVLDVPVALCLPKLDLLVNMNPLGGRAHELLNELRATQDVSMSLELIQRRSDLCAGYMRQMFDDWNVEDFLRKNFGERFMFFPLTPVSLLKNELGRTDMDLRGRTFKPFGIQEPLMWLLHMYGFNVL